MLEKEILSILSSNDNLSKISLLQKIAKEPVKCIDSSIISQLKILIEDKDIAVRFWAKKVYSAHKPDPVKPAAEESVNETLSLEVLFQKLRAAQSHFMANEVLTKIFSRRDSASFKPLVEYLKTCNDPIIISCLVKNLSIFFPSENTLAIVAPYLKHHDDRVVANCVEGLEFISSPKATVLINQMLTHENHRIKANAAKALATKEPETTKKVIRFMLQTKEKPHFIIAGCHAAGYLKSEEFLPDLANLVTSPLLADSALDSIEKIGGENAIGYLEALTEIEDKAIKCKIVQAIENLKRNSNMKIISENLDVALKAGKEGVVALGKTIINKAKEAVQEASKKKEELADVNIKANPGEWFYVSNGERIGPFSEQAIKNFIKAGKITKDTKVWDGNGEWQKASLTSIGYFFKTDENSLPPLSGEDVDNKFAWLIVAVPLIGLFIELLAGEELFKVYFLLNVGACVLDAKRLQAAGHEAPNTFWVMFIPVYLWKRADMLKQKRSYFYGWLAAFFLSAILSSGINQSALEAAAQPLVTKILHQNWGYNTAACKAVRINEEISNGFYKATAILDNGNEIKITIEKKGDNQIYVAIPYHQ